MPTYELAYAKENLEELFQDARTGEDVIIVRRDGLSCQLLPLANVKEEAPLTNVFEIANPGLEGSLVPA